MSDDMALSLAESYSAAAEAVGSDDSLLASVDDADVPEGEDSAPLFGGWSIAFSVIGSLLVVGACVAFYMSGSVATPAIMGLFGSGAAVLVITLSVYAYNCSNASSDAKRMMEEISGDFEVLTNLSVKLHFENTSELAAWNLYPAQVLSSISENKTYEVRAFKMARIPYTTIGTQILSNLTRDNLEVVSFTQEAKKAEKSLKSAASKADRANSTLVATQKRLEAAEGVLKAKLNATLVGQKVVLKGMAAPELNGKIMTIKGATADGKFTVYYKWALRGNEQIVTRDQFDLVEVVKAENKVSELQVMLKDAKNAADDAAQIRASEEALTKKKQEKAQGETDKFAPKPVVAAPAPAAPAA